MARLLAFAFDFDPELAPDLVVASEIGVHFAMRDDADRASLEVELGQYGDVEGCGGRAIVGVVGSRLADGTARRVAVEAMAEWEPELLALGSSGASLAAIVTAERLTETVRGLHHRFFEGDGSR